MEIVVTLFLENKFNEVKKEIIDIVDKYITLLFLRPERPKIY